MVPGRSDGHESVAGFAFHDHIDRLTSCAASMQSCIHGSKRHDGVSVKKTYSFADCALYALVELRSVAGLNLTARRFWRLDFQQLTPQLGVTAKRLHNDRIARGSLGMAGSSVVFLKDWVVDDCGGHDDLRLPIAN